MKFLQGETEAQGGKRTWENDQLKSPKKDNGIGKNRTDDRKREWWRQEGKKQTFWGDLDSNVLL